MRQHADALPDLRRPDLQPVAQADEDRLPGDAGAPRDAHRVMALQRSAGNRVVARMLAPTVQRCGPHGCSEQTEESAGAALSQGMEGVVEESPLDGAQVVQRAADGPAWPVAVQRAATFAAAPCTRRTTWPTRCSVVRRSG